MFYLDLELRMEPIRAKPPCLVLQYRAGGSPGLRSLAPGIHYTSNDARCLVLMLMQYAMDRWTMDHGPWTMGGAAYTEPPRANWVRLDRPPPLALLDFISALGSYYFCALHAAINRC